ncbi:MAG: helix-hairpin-helix domain-containing protein [Candidatus Omnitrophica bacterium]|nr:helix-hairpin-helix domain-containing protein [Candidatus Omnitrophota bacterium]
MAPVPAASWDLALSRARRIDINAASGAELERLPGVGPALASRIIAYRQSAGPFATAEGLREVPGIGPKTFEALRDYVSVDG